MLKMSESEEAGDASSIHFSEERPTVVMNPSVRCGLHILCLFGNELFFDKRGTYGCMSCCAA